MSLLDFSPRIPLGTFSILLLYILVGRNTITQSRRKRTSRCGSLVTTVRRWHQHTGLCKSLWGWLGFISSIAWERWDFLSKMVPYVSGHRYKGLFVSLGRFWICTTKNASLFWIPCYLSLFIKWYCVSSIWGIDYSRRPTFYVRSNSLKKWRVIWKIFYVQQVYKWIRLHSSHAFFTRA